MTQIHNTKIFSLHCYNREKHKLKGTESSHLGVILGLKLRVNLLSVNRNLELYYLNDNVIYLLSGSYFTEQ